MTRKTTLHIITGLNDGGAEAVLYRLCKHDTDTLHRVVSLTSAGKYGPMLEALGVDVTCLEMPRGRVTTSGLVRLWRAIRAGQPDTVQTWMYHANLLGGLAAWVAGRRNIAWGIHHTNLIPGETSRGTMLVARACAWISHVVPRRILCCAEKAIEVHAALGYDRKRMVFTPNGYDLADFRPDALAGADVRGGLGLGDGRMIGFVARYDPLKDHDTLLAALVRLRGQRIAPHCLLVGTGLDRGNTILTSRIRALGLSDQVRLLGRRDDVPAIMNALDLHVMSSISEGFPNVIAEAMACGTPCISTDVGDAVAIVGDTGWIVPRRDPDALAEAIAQALAARARPEWPARQAAARRRIETHFAVDRMVENYRAAWFGQTA